MPTSNFKIALDRRLVVAGMVVVVAGVGAWWWSHRATPPTEWQGYVEANFIKVGPTQAGLLVSLHVARGDNVTIKASLFDQDDTADRAAREQASKQLEQAEDQLANIVRGLLLKGTGLSETLPELWPMALLTLGAVAIAVWSYRETLD